MKHEEYEEKQQKRANCIECKREAATNMHGRCAWCEAGRRNAAQHVERLTEESPKK